MTLLTLLSPWLSPAAAWFIFFNAVVGAIAVMSSTSGAKAGATSSSSPPQRRLCRSVSSSSVVLDRLRSLFVFPVGQLPIDESSAAAASGYHCCSREAEAAATTQVCAPAAERSPQAVVVHATTGETAPISAARPSAPPVAVATAEDHAPPAPPPPEEDKAEAEADNDEQDHGGECISLDEAYALAQRHRVASPLAAASATGAALPTEEHKKKPVAVRRRVPKAAAEEGKAELNARAELFIRQFREDLRLQRLNSILKHTHALGSPTAAR